MISEEHFVITVSTLTQVIPYAKQLTEPALIMLWESFPKRAKLDLTPEMLKFASSQRMLDPDPPKDMALSLSLLRYLYPVKRTFLGESYGKETYNDVPIFDLGVRPDLLDRMSRPEVFHEVAPKRDEHHTVKRMASSGYWTPDMMSDAEKRNHLAAIKKQVEELDLDPKSDPLTIQQLIEGKKWFKDALKGYWTLKADAGGIAKGWVARNCRESLRLIHEAMGLEVPTEEQQEQVTARAVFKDGREQRAWMIAELERQRKHDQGGFGGPLVVELPSPPEETAAAEMTITVEVADPEPMPVLAGGGIGEVEEW